MNIAQTFISTANNNHSILCWDGSNSKDDILENIRCYVSKFTGYKLLYVECDNNILKIAGKTENGRIEQLLYYDVKTEKEIYGRLSHVGFYYPHLKELKTLIIKH